MSNLYDEALKELQENASIIGVEVPKPVDEEVADTSGSGEEKSKISEKQVDTHQEDKEILQDEVDVDEEEEEKKVEPTSRPSRYIPIHKYKDEKRKWQEELEERERKLQELMQKVEEYEAKLNPPVSDEIISKTAQEINVDETVLRKLLDLAWKGVRVPPEYKQELAAAQEKIAEFVDKEKFNEEWEVFEPYLEEQYGNVSLSQLRKAKKAMDELAHAPQFADKELDYIFYKNKDIFDEIFTPPKKGFESRDHYVDRDMEEEEIDIKNAPPSKLLKLHEELSRRAQEEDSFNVTNPVGF